MHESVCLHCSNPPLCNGTFPLSFCSLYQIFCGCFITYMSLKWSAGTGSGSRQWWWRWSKAKWSESRTKAAATKKTHLSKEHGPAVLFLYNNSLKMRQLYNYHYYHHCCHYCMKWLTGCLMMVSQFFQRSSFSCWKKAITGGWRTRQVSICRRESHINPGGSQQEHKLRIKYPNWTVGGEMG